MAGIATTITAEIARMVAKQLRATGWAGKLRNVNARLARLEKRLAKLEASAGRAPAARKGAAAKRSRVDKRTLRFSPASLKRVRATLGVTQGELAALLDVSGNSVWQWEAGRAKPRAKSLKALRELRSAGKRRVQARLEKL